MNSRWGENAIHLYISLKNVQLHGQNTRGVAGGGWGVGGTGGVCPPFSPERQELIDMTSYCNIYQH